MGGGSKGGSADQSGMMQAMAAAHAADQAYALGEQQFQWSQQVWNQEQPLVDQSEKAQIALATQQAADLQQMQNETAQQWDTYQQNYLPEELKYIGQVNDWASPGNQALVRGQAMADIGEQGQAGLNTAAETLREYGVNPSSPKYASLYTSEQPLLGAAEAAAGTTASQNLKLQQLGLESGVINTGRGMVNTTGSLTGAGTQAGAAGAGAASGAGQTAFGNLAGTAVGAGATSQLFNAGTNAMNSYVGAVNGYNDAEAKFAEANASEMGGFGSAAGGILGMIGMKFAEKGGPIEHFADGGNVGGPFLTPPQAALTGIPNQPASAGGIPSAPNIPIPPGGTPGGTVPVYASASGGRIPDDVHAKLTAGEFVIPKDVAMWVGHRTLAAQLDRARGEQQKFASRDDVGGETAPGIPQQPTFVSRPVG